MEHPKPKLGEPAPWFECRSPVNPRFHFDTVAGRYLVLCFFGSSGNDIARKTLDAFLSRRERFESTARRLPFMTTATSGGAIKRFWMNSCGTRVCTVSVRFEPGLTPANALRLMEMELARILSGDRAR